MIQSFKHCGLRRLDEDDDHRGVNPAHVEKINTILVQLDAAKRPVGMEMPGWRLHSLKGGLAGFWSRTVRANWRIIFRFDGTDATDIDYLDDH